MRLTVRQREILCKLVREYFGEDCQLWLFGSRVEDRQRGGDYDFYLETQLADPEAVWERKLALLQALHETSEFEDEKIDIAVRSAVPGPELPIYRVAKEQGIRL